MTTLPAAQPVQDTQETGGGPEPRSGYDVLTRICADTRKEVEHRKALLSQDALAARIRDADPPRGFGRALKDTVVRGGYGLIAEIKKASPSGGLIRPDFNAAALAKAYQAGGATCLSVLTDQPYFQGCPEDLMAARTAVSLPVLRKDFILDPWQVYESRAMGADCILLIMAALTDDEARELEETARHLDLDVLAEVHDEAELDRALALQTGLIGINNRNLKTLKIDLSTTLNIAPLLPPDRFLISESGICTNEDILRLAETGVRSFLIGESLMKQDDVTAAVRALIGTKGGKSAVPPAA